MGDGTKCWLASDNNCQHSQGSADVEASAYESENCVSPTLWQGYRQTCWTEVGEESQQSLSEGRGPMHEASGRLDRIIWKPFNIDRFLVGYTHQDFAAWFEPNLFPELSRDEHLTF
jgi:hypothetical protein